MGWQSWCRGQYPGKWIVPIACVCALTAHAEPETDGDAVSPAALSGRLVRRLPGELERRDIVAKLGFLDGKFAKLPSPICVSGPTAVETDIDPDRSLFVHDRATLDAADFSLRQTLTKLAADANSAGVSGATPEAIFNQLWDTQNPAPGLGLGSHCDDAAGTVNGYPVSCRPADGAQAGAGAARAIDAYQAIGLVNRLDLAGEKWRNCGEHRIVYGLKTGGGLNRSFIIFEAVLPNPRPGCRAACRPVMDFWRSLSGTAMNSPTDRAKALLKFYYQGLPGFRPVVHFDHYSALGATSSYGASGSGQIRTNQFKQQPWLLKEFKLAIDCGTAPCELDVVPIPVKVDPFGHLFSQETATSPPPPLAAFQARAVDFQADLLAGQLLPSVPPAQVASLGIDDIDKFSYAVDLDHDDSESNAQGSSSRNNYRVAFNAAGPAPAGSFRTLFNAGVASLPGGLTSDQILNRATAMSCGGCHNPAIFGLLAPNSLGPPAVATRSWPNSLGFVHTAEQAPTATGIHALSPALNNVFLPARRRFLVEQLNAPFCPCRPRFIVPPILSRKFLDVQEQIINRFAQRITPLEARIATAPLLIGSKLRRQIDQLEQQRESAITAELRKIPIFPALDLAPQPLKLDVAARAAGDRAKERLLRREAVLDLLRAEPARRTVSGHFRAH